MSTTVAATQRPAKIYVPAPAWVAGVIALMFAYVVFAENGAVLAGSWEFFHEAFHDGRHSFGVPCH